MALEQEKETYQKHLPELEQHQGKYVLIHGEEVVDIFESYQDALRQGYRQFGVDEPFLVQLIESAETIHCVTRFVDPAVHGSLHP